MELLQSFEQYRQLIGNFRGRKEVLSNVFFLPGAIKEEIAEQRMFYQSGEDSLFLYQKEAAFYRFYFFITEEAASRTVPEADQSMVVELPFSSSMDEQTEKMQSILLRWGFQVGRRSGRMTAVSQEVVCSDKTIEGIQAAQLEDRGCIYALLYETFNPLFAFLPDEESLKKNIEDGNVLVLKKEDCIAGVLRMDRGRNYASISQFLITRENRGMGLGKMFLDEFHRRCSDAPRFWHWVDLENKPAIHLYQNVGYKFDGRHANEYVKLIKEK